MTEHFYRAHEIADDGGIMNRGELLDCKNGEDARRAALVPNSPGKHFGREFSGSTDQTAPELFRNPYPTLAFKAQLLHGYNPKQIQRLMGHSSIKVTFDVYGHLFADAEADQRAAQNLQARLLGSGCS